VPAFVVLDRRPTAALFRFCLTLGRLSDGRVGFARLGLDLRPIPSMRGILEEKAVLQAVLLSQKPELVVGCLIQEGFAAFIFSKREEKKADSREKPTPDINLGIESLGGWLYIYVYTMTLWIRYKLYTVAQTTGYWDSLAS
jgi:hypothetical protein